MFNFLHRNKKSDSNSRLDKPLKKNSKKSAQARKNDHSQSLDLAWLKWFMQIRVMVGISIMLSVLSASILLEGKVILPIERIKISGEFKQIDTEQIRQQLSVYLGQDFFSVDIQSIQQQLRKEPWVQIVSIKRIWPNQLKVSVREKRAFARWSQDQLLSTQAEIFDADVSGFASLPKINGYAGQTAQLLRSYLDIQHQFSSHGIHVSEFSEDSKGALSLLLNDELKVNIGSEQSDMKIKHLLAVYPQKILPDAEHIKYIDFRYSNGFAIAWKDEYLKQVVEPVKGGNSNV